MKRIYLDNIVFSLQKSGGISIVWYELIKRLLSSKLKNDICFLEFNHAKVNLFRRMLFLSSDCISKRKYYFLPLQRYKNPIIKNDVKFIFHSSYYRTCSNKNAINITTVHDFTYEYFVSGIKKRIHCWQKYRAIRHSDYIICVSENTKKDLLKFLPDVDEKRIKVIYNGVSEEYLLLPNYDENDLPYKKHSYILFVGSRASYKNFSLAVKSLKDTELNLVIVGTELTKNEVVFLEENLKGRYFYVGRISNKKLNLYYNGAFCLMYPSLYEGFGIPVLEAQKAGCPVIAVDSSSIPEVIGDTSFLLKDLSSKEIQDHLAKLQNKEIREQIIKKGLENSNRFTWENMSTQIFKLYHQILQENS